MYRSFPDLFVTVIVVTGIAIEFFFIKSCFFISGSCDFSFKGIVEGCYIIMEDSAGAPVMEDSMAFLDSVTAVSPSIASLTSSLCQRSPPP